MELPTADLQASIDFYTGLFGWTYADVQGRAVAVVGGLPVAELLPADGGFGWTLYLHTPHARATAEKAHALGGHVLREPDETSTLVADPTGGIIGFRHVLADWLFATNGHGTYAWAELNTRDAPAADHFYQELCGYEITQIGDGQAVDYTTWSVAGTPTLGRQRMGRAFPANTPAHWMTYFTAAPEIGTDSVATRVLELGGRISVEPYDTPYGRVTAVVDPSGATFSVIDPTRAVPLTDQEIGAPVDDPYDD
ncbi:VOC family protein [Saccharothrix obliqua]|uniref:VOC family protein n=1 Tax=Saccharothrix obliqua TaxID=2861747 RepID=UPI0027E37EA7|nr:VOC family protein [Saccharothrix obliqua]